MSLALGLVRAGYVIVSRLACGIDSITHRTALEEGKDIFAVPSPIHNRTGRLRESWRDAV